MRRSLAILLVACLATAGLFVLADMADCSGMHTATQTCLASASQGSTSMPNATADPLAHLDFHLQAVQQLGTGTVAWAGLLGLITVALAAFVPWLHAPPLASSRVRRYTDSASPIPRVVQRLTRWLTLLQKRDRALQA